MIILRQKTYSLKDTLKTMFRGAVKELNKEMGPTEFGETIYGTLVIDRFIDKGRFIGKDCMFKVSENLEVQGNGDSRSHIFWDLSYKFEPTENCPKTWKSFTIAGTCKSGETLDASIIKKDGKVLKGRVMVEVR